MITTIAATTAPIITPVLLPDDDAFDEPGPEFAVSMIKRLSLLT